MHPCISCGNMMPDEIVQNDYTYRNNIVYRKDWRIKNLICDDCIAEGWRLVSDKHSDLHVIKITSSDKPDEIFTMSELVLEGD